MAQQIRHASAVKPITIPVNADVDPQNIDRLQSFSGGVSQPSEFIYEIGRLDKVCTDKGILEVTASLTQLEYGTIDFYLQLANLASEPVGGLELSDFNNSKTDIYQPGKDAYAGNVEQTLWLPKLVVDTITLDIADPEARIERSVDLSGDIFELLRYNNKYLIFKTNDAPTGTSGNYVIALTDPAPVQDPNTLAYIKQLVRIRSGVATELVLTTDYTYTPTNLTILSALTGDHYRIWYSASSYGTAGDPFVLNDSDDCYLKADSVTVLLDDGVHTPVELDRLTSLSISATLNRINEAVIGSDEKILKDVQDYTVDVSLEGRIKNATIQEVLMGKAGLSWGIINPLNYGEVDLIVKIYEDETKSTFKIGYKVTGLNFSDESEDFNANEFGTNPITLSSDNLLITETEGNL